mmetsp:Transcript_7660/g.47283  ORF Transcript_7660/g.47283 Transcript_7660/m.47283 type:complete len:262 (+) Transcript_7660:3733-4518(+)
MKDGSLPGDNFDPGAKLTCDCRDCVLPLPLASIDGKRELVQSLVHFCIHLSLAREVFGIGIQVGIKSFTNLGDLCSSPFSCIEDHENTLFHAFSGDGIDQGTLNLSLFHEHVPASGPKEHSFEAEHLLLQDQSGDVSQSSGHGSTLQGISFEQRSSAVRPFQREVGIRLERRGVVVFFGEDPGIVEEAACSFHDHLHFHQLGVGFPQLIVVCVRFEHALFHFFQFGFQVVHVPPLVALAASCTVSQEVRPSRHVQRAIVVM